MKSKIKKGKVDIKIGNEKVVTVSWDLIHKKVIKEIKKCIPKSKIPNVQDDILRAVDKDLNHYLSKSYIKFIEEIEKNVETIALEDYPEIQIVWKKYETK